MLGMLRASACVLALLGAACASAAPSGTATGAPAPRAVLIGRAAFVFEPIQGEIPADELRAAIAPMVARAAICMRFPGIWLDGEMRLSAFVVRYDLMQRDWGSEVSASARQRMDEFVEMGFLTAAPRGEAVAYTLTPLGRAMLRGGFGGGRPPSFCGASEHRLLEIVSTERGAFPCGSVRVRFSHVGDAWPSWAASEAARRYVAAAGASPGEASEGSVSLSRRWYARDILPARIVNGSLGSLCYDARRDLYRGDDFIFIAARNGEPLDADDMEDDQPVGDPLSTAPPSGDLIETAPLGPPESEPMP